MKKLIPAVLLLIMLTLVSCAVPQLLRKPTPTPTSSPTATITPTPTATATFTPTPTPTITPTPEPKVRVAEADDSLFKGDYEAALDEYQAAYQASGDPAVQAAALLGQGRIHYLSGIYPNALNEFREVANVYPASPQAAEAYYFMGETFMLLSRYAEAAEAFSSYITIRPGVLDAFINERRGDALASMGDYANALGAYILAVQSPRLPSNMTLELKLAQTYVILGDYATAGVVYDDIFNRTSSDDIKAQVEYARGQMYTLQGDTEQGTTSYVNAVFNYPRTYYAYLSLVELVNASYPVDDLQRGLVDYYAKQYGVALVALDNYLNSNPSDPSTALFTMGMIYRKEGDHASSIADWDLVIQGEHASPVWDRAWEEKAYTQWFYLDDNASAEVTLLDFVSTAPDHARAAEFLYDAGRAAERDGRCADAAKTWQRVVLEYPNSEYVYRSLFLAGICYYRLADYPSALAVFQQVQPLAKTPGDRAGAFFWIGKSQLALADPAAAKASWQQAASIDPTGYYSERARERLNDRLPFTPPQTIDLGVDRQSELRQAVLWMQATFNYPSGTDFSVPGPMAGDPRFLRGQEFWNLGLDAFAEAEFDDLRQSASNDPLTSFRLAAYLSEAGIYRQAVLSARQVLDLAGLDDAGTLTAPLFFSHIRFGAYFADQVTPAAEASGFHPLFVWSVMRQESLFDPGIMSGAGAMGLMQIMPETGREIYSRLGWPEEYTESDLLRPEVNVTFGIEYLSRQRDALDGDLYATLAAYNGGPGNAAEWHALAKGDPDLLVEVVRYEETRKYLMAIYEIFSIYSRLYARAP